MSDDDLLPLDDVPTVTLLKDDVTGVGFLPTCEPTSALAAM